LRYRFQMNDTAAASAFAAIGHPTRLKALQLVCDAGGSGLPVGEVATRLGISDPLASSHLRILAAAGLIDQERRGKSTLCVANAPRIRETATHLKGLLPA